MYVYNIMMAIYTYLECARSYTCELECAVSVQLLSTILCIVSEGPEPRH
jgi:hypothetical protein